MANKPAPAFPEPVSDLDALATSEVFSPAGIEVPEQVKTWVEDGFTYWQAHPKEWRHVALSAEQAATDILAQARHYAKVLRAEALTVQVREIKKAPTDTRPEAVRLVYRVRTRVLSGRKPTTAGE